MLAPLTALAGEPGGGCPPKLVQRAKAGVQLRMQDIAHFEASSWLDARHVNRPSTLAMVRSLHQVPAMPAKRFVYTLQSESDADQKYVGVTSAPDARLERHNSGKVPSTARYAPWRRIVLIEFEREAPALSFERYLKTGSGRAFAKRRLW